jgi:hypothetical protein
VSVLARRRRLDRHARSPSETFYMVPSATGGRMRLLPDSRALNHTREIAERA